MGLVEEKLDPNHTFFPVDSSINYWFGWVVWGWLVVWDARFWGYGSLRIPFSPFIFGDPRNPNHQPSIRITIRWFKDVKKNKRQIGNWKMKQPTNISDWHNMVFWFGATPCHQKSLALEQPTNIFRQKQPGGLFSARVGAWLYKERLCCEQQKNVEILMVL